jgi:hypothetical protein
MTQNWMRATRFFTKRALIAALRRAEGHLPMSLVKNSYQVRTLGDQLFWAVQAFIPLGSVVALDPFAGSGFMMSHSYLHHCRHADLWDIDPFNAGHVKYWGNQVTGYCGDSIAAINNQDPRVGRYNFIILDNPLGGPYGTRQYCEHFDLMPAVFRCFKQEYGVLVLNYIPDIDKLVTDPRFQNTKQAEQHERRTQFYGTREKAIRPRVAVAKYAQEAAREGFRVTDHNIIPRSPHFHFLMLFLEPLTGAESAARSS